MSLQDQLLADFSATLTDPDGPAQVAAVAGKDIRVIIDQPGITSTDPRTGLMICRMDLYLRTDDLGYRPLAGAEVEVAGTTWYVEHPYPHGPGVTRLALYRHAI